ncbi:MAG: hypothetical protein ACOCZ8_03665 [Bacteroidota bacterium]
MKTLLFSLMLSLLAPFAIQAQSVVAIHYLMDDGKIFVRVAGPNGEIDSFEEAYTKPERSGSGFNSEVPPAEQLKADVANNGVLLKVIDQYASKGYEIISSDFGRGLDDNDLLKSRSRTILLQKEND